jgi:hypothetical protein
MKAKNFIFGFALPLLMSIGMGANAQTTILSENFEGGSGTTLASWTFVNGSQANKWYVGTAAGNGSTTTGSRAAYISNDGGTYNYNIYSSSVVHLYRNVTTPSPSTATLSFDWKGYGESSNYDYLQVFLVDATVTPTAGTLLSSPLAIYNLSSSWQRASITLPILAGNKRLVFSWYNDVSVGTQPPAAIDNITLISTPLVLVSKTVNLIAAGTLQSVADIASVQKLTLTGNIDARDVKFMRDNMPSLIELDLSGATVVAHSGLGGTYSSSTSYPANEMPQYSFHISSTNTGKTSLASVKLPAGLTSIGSYAFTYCSGLSGSLTLPAGLTSIGSYAFYSCSGLSDSLTLPAGLTSIGNSAFTYCSGFRGSLTLPADLISIGSYAFQYCSGLSGSLTLPAGLTSIGSYAFQYCSGFTSVTNLSLTPQGISSDVFSGVNIGSLTLIAPISSISLYKNAPVWSSFYSIFGGVQLSV